jgi:hypothetical protein
MRWVRFDRGDGDGERRFKFAECYGSSSWPGTVGFKDALLGMMHRTTVDHAASSSSRDQQEEFHEEF